MIRRWETPTRYYMVSLHLDLLGDVVLMSANGGKYNRLGQLNTLAVPTWGDGLKAIEAIDQRRRKRHYVEVKIRRAATNIER